MGLEIYFQAFEKRLAIETLNVWLGGIRVTLHYAVSRSGICIAD